MSFLDHRALNMRLSAVGDMCAQVCEQAAGVPDRGQGAAEIARALTGGR